MKYTQPHGIEPSATDDQILRTVAGRTAWSDERPPAAILLDKGQTVAQYETAHGVTVAAGTLIFEKAV